MAFAFVLAGASPAGAQGVPEHLASMARVLFDALERKENGALEGGRAGGGTAGSGVETAEEDAAARARAILRRAGVHRWAARPLRLAGAARALGDAVPAELGGPAQGPEIAALAADVAGGDAEGAAARLLAARSRRADADDRARLAAALGEAWGEAWGERATRHVLAAGEGEEVEVGWLRDAGRAYLKARAAREGAAPFEAMLRGEATPRPDPATGDLVLEASPGAAPMAVLDEGEHILLQASILGAWRAGDGSVYRISAVDAGSGRIPPDPARIQAILDTLEERIESLRRAKIYVWRDEQTGHVVRQTRFQRLDPPYVYQGERFDETDAEARIGELEEDVEALRAERDAASKRAAATPRVLRGPLGDANALRVAVAVQRPDGYAYTYDTARFDGRRLVAERTYRDVRDVTNEGLPPAVRRQLVASWSPGAWIELEATLDPESGDATLGGALWTQHVTYSRGAFGAGEPTVKSVHSPRAEPLHLRREGTRLRRAEAAPADTRP